jgi:hypothetical protein
MRSSDRSFPGFPPYMQETRNEEVNETGNEVETRLVLLCKTGNEGNSGGAKSMETKKPFLPLLVSTFPFVFSASFPPTE